MESWKRELKKFSDLYGMDVLHEILVTKGYTHVSMREKSIPDDGSAVHSVHRKKSELFSLQKIEKIILHRNNDVTIKTDIAYLRYFIL